MDNAGREAREREEYENWQRERKRENRRGLLVGAVLFLVLAYFGVIAYRWGWMGNLVVPYGTVTAKETGLFGSCYLTLVHEADPEEIVHSCSQNIYDSVEEGQTIYYRFESNFWSGNRRIIQVGTEQELERAIWGQ